MVDEAYIPVEAINIDQVLCDRLVKLPSQHFSASRTGIASA